MTTPNLPDISFFDETFEEVLERNIKLFEECYFQEHEERYILHPGDPIRIQIYASSYREYQLCKYNNELAKQNSL